MMQMELLQQENALLKAQIEEYRLAYEKLLQEVKDLRRHRFGKRSEKQIVTESVTDTDECESSEEESIEIPAHQRRKKKKKDLSKYSREIRIIPVSAEDRLCQCGCKREVIRYETKEMFHCTPAIYCIVEQRREVVACRHGCEHSIKTAPTPQHILPKVKATEEMLASIVIDKLHNRQPHYHLAKYTEGVGLNRDTLSRWMIQLVKPLQPIYNLIKDSFLEYDIGGLDATTLQVLNEPNRKAETKSYLYCMRGGPPNQPSVLYAYNAEDHKTFVDDWFEGFAGYLHMDADNFWGKLQEDESVNGAYCNAHARRKFEAVAKQAKKQGLAHEAVRYYKKLYKIERRAKNEAMSHEQRYQLRQNESEPLLKTFKAWLDEKQKVVLPKSPLGNAFNYAINHWSELITFLDDGRIEIDNNLTEQEIKPIVMARKNFMFANSIDGANALCLHFTLIRSALHNGLSPYRYYVALLKAIPNCKSVEDYEKLLPWNIKITNPELLL